MLPISDVIPSRTVPWMTMGIIGVTAISVVYAWSLPAGAAYEFADQLAFHPAHPSFGAATTALVVHQGAMHFLLNAVVLWIFGDNVEDQLGHLRFLALYLLSGYAGWACSLWATSWTEGAALISPAGAIAGVVGAYFTMFPRSRVLVLVPARTIIDAIELPAVFIAAAWLSLQALSLLSRLDRPFASPGLSLWPFVGGMAAGMIAGRLIRRPERQRVEWWGR
jgi:membrane associated rhomboid family serine protease